MALRTVPAEMSVRRVENITGLFARVRVSQPTELFQLTAGGVEPQRPNCSDAIFLTTETALQR
jgi:hypothetical protein